MWRRFIICMLALSFMGCVSYSKTEDELHVRSLGIATVGECTEYEGREDGVVKECTEIETNAFSAWATLIDGAANAVIKILTLGLL